MDKNNKKRNRKPKLMPRKYSDSDDESIALMQQEIELELANIKAQSILRKLSASNLTNQKSFQFSVNVEIENCDDNDDDNNDEQNDSLPNKEKGTTRNDYSEVNESTSMKTDKYDAVASTSKQKETEDSSLQKEEVTDISDVEERSEVKEEIKTICSDDGDVDNGVLLTPIKQTDFRVESVKTLAKSTKAILSYRIPDKMICDEFEFVCKQTTHYADRLLEMRLRNYYAKDVRGILNNCEIDIGIQEALKKWKMWQIAFPIVRGPPIMYICSKCKLGFWHLHDFREHLQDHADINFSFVSEEHVSYVIGHLGRKVDKQFLSIDSDCWRCGKGFKCHNDVIFKCNGCNRYFETCLLMSIHEATCEENKNNFVQSENMNTQYKCLVCPYKYFREEDIERHLIGLHSVRSDVPIFWSTKKCRKCDGIVNHSSLHECSERPGIHVCKFCSRRFQSKHNIMIHYWFSPNNFECRICKKVLKKECMEQDHLLSHSKSYTAMYKCLLCKEGPYFVDKKLEQQHNYNTHKKRFTTTNFEKVIVPKTLLKKLKNNKKFIRKEMDIPNSDTKLEINNYSNVINDNIRVLSKCGVQFRQPTHNVSKSGDKRKTESIADKNPPSIANNKDDKTPITNIKQEIEIEINNDTKTKSSEIKRKSEIPIENESEIKRMADLDLINIKEEPVDFLDIVAVAIETDEVDETNDDDMNLFNGVNDELNLELQAQEVNLPIKYEVDEANYKIIENNTMDTDFSLNNMEENHSSQRAAYNHPMGNQPDEPMDITDPPLPLISNVFTEALDPAASISVTQLAEPPTISSPKSKAQKQREYRQRIAALRTRAQVIAVRELNAARQRKCRLRKIGNLAHVSGLIESTTASSSRSGAGSFEVQTATDRQFTHQLSGTSEAETGQNTVQPGKQQARSTWNSKWASSIMRFKLIFLDNDFGYACSVCDKLWFKNDLRPITTAQLEVISEWFIKENRRLCREEYEMACKSCRRTLNRKSMPLLAKVNGFSYPDQPPGLPPLDPISERLISPRLPFKQVRRLRNDFSYGITAQVINVPVEVHEMAKYLPRQLNEDDVINVNVRRNLAHKSTYISGYMSKSTISAWLTVLQKSSLYRMYEINVDLSRLHPNVLYFDDIQDDPSDRIENISAENMLDSEILASRQHTMTWNEEDYFNITPRYQATSLKTFFDHHAEELSFPAIYFGEPRRYKMGAVTPYMIATSEIRRRDRRGATPQKILYVAMKVLRLRIVDRLYSKSRSILGTENVTRCMLEDTEFLKEFVIQNLTFMKTTRKRDLFAIIRQLGKPTFFLSISANEIHWMKLLTILLKLSKKYPGKTAEDLNISERCTLVSDDPVTCCIYFYRLVDSLMKMLQSKVSYNPFDQYFVKDYFLHIEFEHQGSPHAHILLWLNDDPREAVSENMPKTIDLVEELSSVARDDVPNNSVYANQIHRHTNTCIKQGDTTCRFGIPYWPMLTTRVLVPIPESDERRQMLRQKAKELRTSLGEHQYACMDEFLNANGLTYVSYLDILRSTLQRPTVMFRRNFDELMTKTFNPYLAGEVNSSIDIQFILDEYSCAEYVVKYINKTGRGMSNLRRELTTMMQEHPDRDYTSQLKALSIKLLSAVEMSAQEAAWYLLRQPMSETSCQVVYIPTVWPTERQCHRKRRQKIEQEGVDGDSTDVWTINVIQRYEERPASLEQVYLAEFASWYAHGNDFVDEEDDVHVDDDEDLEGVPESRTSRAPKEYRRRQVGRVIRYRGYNINETINYKREMVLLYVQFRNEMSEIVDQNNFLQLFDDNKDMIMERRDLYETNLNIENVVNDLEAVADCANRSKPEKVLKTYMKTIHNDRYTYRCSKCKRVYQSFKEYLNHFVLHGYNSNACPQCLAEFPNVELLYCHVNMHIKHNYMSVVSIHNESTTEKSIRKFQCKICQEILVVTEFFTHWEKHLMVQEKAQQRGCAVDMDGKPFLRDMIIYMQQPEKHTFKSKTCIQCKKKFLRIIDFKRHIIQHLLDDAYAELMNYGNLTCQICGAGFQTEDRYKRHVRDHASLPVYKCEICDKTFSDSSNFSKHKKVHNLHVLICDICGKKFKNKTCLIKHLNLHETMKQINCEKCKKKFYTQSAYKKHLKKRTHFTCPICRFPFNSIKERSDHLWEVHKKRNCQADCPICGASYRKKTDVKRHMAEVHGEQSLTHYYG